MCARKEQYLLFDQFKAFVEIESSHKSDFFSEKPYSELSKINTMIALVPGF